MNNGHVVYYFIRPDGTPFYVGITNNFKRRKRRHYCNILNGNSYPKYNKARKLISEGFIFDQMIIIVERNLTEEEAKQREIDLIRELKDKGIKLYNLTAGGEGFSGFSKEQMQKMADKRRGKKLPKEVRRKISEARKGMKFSEEHKKNLSKAWENRTVTKETCIKMSKASKGKINIKRYKLIDPSGIEYFTTEGLVKFCEEHDLTPSNFMKVLSGERTHHKGWRIERLERNDNQIIP